MKAKDVAKILMSNPEFEVELCLTTPCDTGCGVSFERFKINGLEDIGYSDQVLILDIEKTGDGSIKPLNTQPTEQPSETCKWRWGKIGGRINPHFPEAIEWSETFTYCPTCGLKIEVVE